MKLDVDAQSQVVARYRRHVVAPVVVATLDLAHSVAYEHLLPLAPAQKLLVALFQAQVARVVAWLVVGVLVDVVLVHLAYVAQHVGCRQVVVLAQDALLHVEAREAVQLLLDATAVLGREVGEQHLLDIGRVAALALHLVPALVQLLA